MTHDELLVEVNRRLQVSLYNGDPQSIHALRAVVQLHKPNEQGDCYLCTAEYTVTYPCLTVQAIEKELQ